MSVPETNYEEDFYESNSFEESENDLNAGNTFASTSAYPKIFHKENEGSIEIGGSGSILFDTNNPSISSALATPTAQPMSLGIEKYVYTGRETFCDIMCTTNTAKMYVVPPVRNPKIKDTIVTLPYSKKYSLSSIGKGETPWQKLKFEEARQKRNEMLKKERSLFLEQLSEDKRRIDEEDQQAADFQQTEEYKALIEIEESESQTSSSSRAFLFVKYGQMPTIEKSRKVDGISKDEERKMIKEVNEVHDELCALASKLGFKPIKGLTLEPRGKASKRKKQIENAASRRMQRWCRMIIAKRAARARCTEFRDMKRNNAARTICRMFRNAGQNNFKAKMVQGQRDAAATVIQCAGRKFIAVHRVRVLKRLALRKRLEKHAAIIIHRNAKIKLRYMEPRKQCALQVVGLVAENLVEEELVEKISVAQVDGMEDAFATLAVMGVVFKYLDEYVEETLYPEYEALIIEREMERLHQIEEERIALEIELVKRAEEEAARAVAEEEVRRKALAEEEARQVAIRSEKKAQEEARILAEKAEKARKIKEEIERKAAEALAAELAAKSFAEEQKELERQAWEQKKIERERQIREEMENKAAKPQISDPIIAKIDSPVQTKSDSPLKLAKSTAERIISAAVANVSPASTPISSPERSSAAPYSSAESPTLSMANTAVRHILENALGRMSPASVVTSPEREQSYSSPRSGSPVSSAIKAIEIASEMVQRYVSSAVKNLTPQPARRSPQRTVAEMTMSEVFETLLHVSGPQTQSPTVRKDETASMQSARFKDMLQDMREHVIHGDYDAAQQLLGELELYATDGTIEKPLWAEFKVVAGMHYRSLGQHAEAIGSFEEALAMQIELNGPQHCATAEARLGVASLLNMCGKYIQAETQQTDAISILKAAVVSHAQSEEGQNQVGKDPSVDEVRYRTLLGRGLLGLASLQSNRGCFLAAENSLVESASVIAGLKDELLTADHMFTEASQSIIKGGYTRAAALLNQVIKIRSEIWDTRDHPLVGSTLIKLGRLATIKGDYVQASTFIEEGSSILSKLAFNHPLVATACYAKGKLLQAIGQYSQARDVFFHCLQIRKEQLGEHHYGAVRAVIALADVTRDYGFPLEAESLMSEAKTIIDSVHQAASVIPDTISSEIGQNRLLIAWSHSSALFAEAVGNYPKAENLFEDACSHYSKLINELQISVHPDHETCKVGLARVYIALGKLKLSKSVLSTAGKNLVGALGAGHGAVADSFLALGAAVSASGKYKDAAALFEKAMSIKITLLGERHPALAPILLAIAENERLPGKFDSSLDCVERALSLQKRVFSENSSCVAMGSYVHAQILRDADQLESAVAIFKDVLAVLVTTLGQSSSHVGRCLADWAECARLLDKHDLAESSIKKSIRILESIFGLDHFVLAGPRRELALLLMDQNFNSEAVEILHSIVPVQTAVLGQKHPSTVYTKALIGLCVEDQDAVDDALDYFDTHGGFTETHPWIVELGGFSESVHHELRGGGSVSSTLSNGTYKSAASNDGDE